jgi:LPXTG-site transpeptidase (sortase) family protein
MDATVNTADDLLRSRLRRPTRLQTAGHTSFISDVRPAVSQYRRRPTPQPSRVQTLSAPKPIAIPVTSVSKKTAVQQPVVKVVSEPKTSTISTTQVAAPKKLASRSKRWLKIKKPSVSFMLIAAAVFVFLIGGYVAFDSWRTNRAAEAAVKKISTPPAVASAQTSQPPAETAPATTAPSANDVDNYKVAATKPRVVTIPKIGVKARILPEGVAKDGSLAAPGNVHDAGWYTASSLPGQAGAMLLDGHVSSWTTNGVFYNLKKLVAGDTISVERGDGKVYQYKVVKSQSYDANSVDMQAAVTPVVPGMPGLNLITCTGKVKPGTSEFSERLIVFTKQVN